MLAALAIVIKRSYRCGNVELHQLIHADLAPPSPAGLLFGLLGLAAIAMCKIAQTVGGS